MGKLQACAAASDNNILQFSVARYSKAVRSRITAFDSGKLENKNTAELLEEQAVPVEDGALDENKYVILHRTRAHTYRIKKIETRDFGRAFREIMIDNPIGSKQGRLNW